MLDLPANNIIYYLQSKTTLVLHYHQQIQYSDCHSFSCHSSGSETHYANARTSKPLPFSYMNNPYKYKIIICKDILGHHFKTSFDDRLVYSMCLQFKQQDRARIDPFGLMASNGDLNQKKKPDWPVFVRISQFEL